MSENNNITNDLKDESENKKSAEIFEGADENESTESSKKPENEKKSKNKDKKPSKFLRSFKTKAFRAGGYSVAASAIIIIIAVLINILMSSISQAYTKIDTTESRLYSIGDETKERLSSISKETSIYYIASPEERSDYVLGIIDKFAKCSENIKAQEINPDEDPKFASQFTDETVRSGDLIVTCGDKSKIIRSEDMIEYEAGSYQEYYYYLQNGQQTAIYWKGETELMKAVDFVTDGKIYKAYFLDAGEDGDYSNLEELLSNENIISATLPKDAKKIPNDANCVIITEISEDISQKELNILKTYLGGGGKIYIDYGFNEEEDFINLKSLISLYGAKFTDATLEDGDRNLNGQKDLIMPNIDNSHPVTSPFSDASKIAFPKASGIEIKDASNVTSTSILKTSESAYLSTDDSDNLKFSTFTLGAAFENSSNKSKMIILGSSSYAESEYLESAELSNSDIFINSVSYLCGKENALTIHPKPVTSDTTLDFGEGKAQSFLTAALIIPVAAAIIAGVWIRERRKAR